MISTRSMCELAHCSYRQLDYWIRQGVVHPIAHAHGPGSRRHFAERQVPIVRMVTELANLGATEKVLRAAASEVELIPGFDWSGTAFIDAEGRVTREPSGSCWAVSLDHCSEGVIVRQLALV